MERIRGDLEELSPGRRIAGVLVPVFSLRNESDQGIGDTECLIEFIDWAAKIGFGLVKTLPVNETGMDNSPYNAISSNALDPCLLRVTPEAVSDLSQEDYERIALEMPSEGLRPDRVRYQTVKTHKLELLKAAFARSLARTALNPASGNPLVVFASQNADWMEDYALFRALCDTNGADWTRWPSHFASPRSARRYLADRVGLSSVIERNIAFYKYVQWQAALQWEKVHDYAAQRGVALMGDIPFGVNYYSADVWAERDLFLTDWSGGTPPDGFFAHDEVIRTIGQNWGIPLYNWDQMRGDDLRWWRRRVRLNRRYFDLLRIDHVLGCYRIYGFPWRPERNREFLELTRAEIAGRNSGRTPRFFPASDDDPVDAAQNRASGEALLRALLDESGPHRLIGEDLGFLPPYVRESLESLGMAGYRIPQWEKTAGGALADGTSYPRLSLAMYGTHDHDPLKSVWRTMAEAGSGGATDSRNEFEAFCAYANIAPHPDGRFSAEVHTALLAALFASNAWIAVLQIADVFGWEDRINLPGTSNDENWTCRLPSSITNLHLEGTAPDVSNLISRSGRSRPQVRTKVGFT